MRFFSWSLVAAAVVTSICFVSQDAVSRLAHRGAPEPTPLRTRAGKSELAASPGSERIVFAPVTVIGELPRKAIHHR